MINGFRTFLRAKGYSEGTVKTYVREVECFTVWLKKKKFTAEQIDYKGILQYVKHLQSKSLKVKSINYKIRSLKLFFDYLTTEEYRDSNPIEHLVIRGTKKTISQSLLSKEELEDLYFTFQTKAIERNYSLLVVKRDKIMVGLMVFQGLNTTDLKNLEVEDVQFSKGKLYVKSTRRSNSRLLELKSWQVMELFEYVTQTRDEILTASSKKSDKLFEPNNKRLDITVSAINQKLKKQNAKVINLNQIRASVITLWLKEHNLRVVQYMAGHRFISSTEKYLQEDLEDLQEIINSRHPLR